MVSRRVACDGLFRERGLEASHLDGFRDRRRIKHVESLDMRVPAIFLEMGKNPVGDEFVVRRADMVGFCRKKLEPARLVLAAQQLVETRQQRILGRCRGGNRFGTRRNGREN